MQTIKSVHGKWHLWIYMCDWIIEFKNQVICNAESDDLAIQRACAFLNGQILESVKVNSDSSTDFCFDLGGVLKTVPYSGSEVIATWILYCPDNSAFSMLSDGNYEISQQESIDSTK